MKKYIFGVEDIKSLKLDIGLLGMRLFFGLTMAFAHGFKKMPPSDGFSAKIAEMGLPFPDLMAWCASFSEFFGGILIALGLFTRFSASSLAFTMFIAAFVAHGSDPFGKKELALCFMFVSLFFALIGPGRISLDRVLNGRFK